MVPERSIEESGAFAEVPDERLLKGVAAKNEAAFERLYKRYYNRVLQFVGRMVKDRRLAEEVVDDTMFAVWKSAARYEGRSQVSTWLFGIAYRRALKTLDGNKRHAVFDNAGERVSLAVDSSPHADPGEKLASDDLRRQIDEGIDQLSDDHRAVMTLTAMGYNYTEIAGIVDCPVNTIKTRMFYARKNLRKVLSTQTITALTRKRQDNSWSHGLPIS